MRFLIAILCILFCANANAQLYPVQSYALDNGLQVILAKNDGADVVSQVIFYKAGRIDEIAGKSGVAHFLEHLMFRGENKNYSSIIEKMGGNTNAYTSQDMTAYYAMASSNHLEQLLKMESARMDNLSFSDDEFAAEKSVVVQERVMRYDGSPRAQFLKRVDSIRWDRHPYSIPIIGHENEFDTVTRTDIVDFYNKFYSPNNAILVLSGNFDVKLAKELVKKYYGPKQKKSVSHIKNVPPANANIRIEATDKRISEDMLIIYKNIPALTKGDNKETYASIIISEYLGGMGYNSKLYKELVLNEEIATDASASASGNSRDIGTFAIYVLFNDKDNLKDIEDIIKDEIKDIAKNGIDEKMLTTIKKVFLANIVFEKENLFKTANKLGQSAIISYDINTMENDIKSITNEDIKLVAQKLLNEYSTTLAYLGKEVKADE